MQGQGECGVRHGFGGRAGYEDQSWEKAESLPNLVIDGYWACKEGFDDDDDPEDPPPPPVVVSETAERDLLVGILD